MKSTVNHHHFNSELTLEGNFAFLDLNINTHFNFVNVLAPFDKKRRLEQPDWNTKMKKDFIDKYLDAIEKVWNDKLWLSSNKPWGTSYSQTEYNKSLPIICSINIIVKKYDKSNLHQVLKVLNRKPNNTDAGAAWMNGIGNGEGTLMIDSNDERQFTIDGINANDIPSAHEFGHFLGFEHVGVNNEEEERNKSWGKNTSYKELVKSPFTKPRMCYPGSNDVVCYKGDDVMGLKMTINKWHAKPWIERIKNHLDDASVGLVFTANLGSPPDAPLRLLVGR